jgi:hypothetical protein
MVMDNTTVWKEWDELIVSIIRESLNELGEMIEHKVRANIDEHVYVGQNEVYEPTYEFRESWDSVDVSKGRDAEVIIRSDKGKINSIPEKFQHGSYYWRKGSDISDYLPEILAFNLSGDFFGANQWYHNRESYFYETLKELQANGWLSKTFKQLLRKRGLSVK